MGHISPNLAGIFPPNKNGKINETAIDDLETYMIQVAEIRNDKLLNKKKKASRKWSVKGVIDAAQGQPGKDASSFKTMMGL